MSAVAEQPVPAVKDNATPPFAMPAVRLGQEVFWYPSAQRSMQPCIAKVTRVTHLLIECVSLRNNSDWALCTSVRHIDDPYLRQNPNWLKWGAWDFTEHDKHLAAQWAALESRLDALESPASEAAQQQQALQRLRGELSLRDIVWDHRWGLPKLTKLVEDFDREHPDWSPTT